MAPDRTILCLFKKKIADPLPLTNYGVHTIKPQLRPWQARSSLYANTQLRAHRRAEKKIKSNKNKINKE